MHRFLLSRRWVSLYVVALLVIPGCVWCAMWQLDRLHLRQAQNAQVSANAEAAPRPLAEITSVGGTIAKADEWRAVTITGRYDLAHQMYVRNRPVDGRRGFFVFTPVVTPAGPAAFVNRGWVEGTGDPLANPPAPPTPDGEVTVVGRLRPSEDQSNRGPRDAADVPAGQIVRMDVPRLAPAMPYPVYAGFVQLAEQTPPLPLVEGEFTPKPLGLPSHSELLHWSYAVQWFVFAGIVPIGVVLLVRREFAEHRRSTRPGGPRPSEELAKDGQPAPSA